MEEEVVSKWDSIEIVSSDKVEAFENGDIESGKDYTITYVIDEKGLDDAVGLEMVTTHTPLPTGSSMFILVEHGVNNQRRRNSIHIPGCLQSVECGSFKYAFRMYLRIRIFRTVRISATCVGLSDSL